MSTQAPSYELAGAAAAEAAFLRRYPGFDPDGAFARLRRTEYGRLDRTGHVYLDYTGGGLHADGQIEAHAALLHNRVLGNPHSNNPASLASSQLVEQARQAVCDFFRAPREEYLCVFTANASAALRLVGEAYPFAPGGRFALTVRQPQLGQRHPRVRPAARRAGLLRAGDRARAPRRPRGDEQRAAGRRAGRPHGGPQPAGLPGPVQLLRRAAPPRPGRRGAPGRLGRAARRRGLRADEPVDIGAIAPDFAAFSFYKIIGYPTGVGCLLIRRDRAALLDRPWFAGGTVTIASVRGDGHYLRARRGRLRGRHRRLPQPARGHGRPPAHPAGRARPRSSTACTP